MANLAPTCRTGKRQYSNKDMLDEDDEKCVIIDRAGRLVLGKFRRKGFDVRDLDARDS